MTVHVHSGHARGVLAATQRLGQAATLPFTGERLWLVAMLGVLLIANPDGRRLRRVRS